MTVGLIAGKDTGFFRNGMQDIADAFTEFVPVKNFDIKHAETQSNKRKKSNDVLILGGKIADIPQKKMDKTFHEDCSQSSCQTNQNGTKNHKLLGIQFMLNPKNRSIAFNNKREKTTH